MVENDINSFSFENKKEDELKTFFYGECFEKGGIDLLEYTVHQSLDFHKTIQDLYYAKEYV